MATPRNVTVKYEVSTFDDLEGLWTYMDSFRQKYFSNMRFIDKPHGSNVAFKISLAVGNKLLQELDANPPENLVILVCAIDSSGQTTLKFSNHVAKVLTLFKT